MNPRTLVLLLAIAALLARLYCAATTVGTSDVVLFWKFAHTIQRDGLLAMYRLTEFFNHTPLVGWFSQAALALSGGEQRLFAFYLRLPAVFADFFAVLALLAWREKTGRPAWWALAVFAASPVAFMVSGYHGNVDSVMALGILLAALACAAQRPALSGLCLGLACNLKIIPLLLAPALFFFWWHRGRAARFSVTTILVVLAGWSYPLFTIPAVFLKNVLGYSGFWGVWGLTYLLRWTGLPALREMAFADTTPQQAAIMQGLKLLIVLAVLALAWRRRKVEPPEIFRTVALTWTIFFVFAPGFGAQYLAWLAPFFLLANERWFAALTAASSVALFAFYTVISRGLPWDMGFTVHSIAAQWAGWLLLPWLVLVAFLVWQVRGAFAKTSSA
jgi:hypothetical protein